MKLRPPIPSALFVKLIALADIIDNAGDDGYQYRQRSKMDGGGDLPIFLAVKSLKDFIDSDLRAAVEKPKLYITLTGGKPANGVDAKLIPLICDVWLKARDAGSLSESQLKIATKADILMRISDSWI